MMFPFTEMMKTVKDQIFEEKMRSLVSVLDLLSLKCLRVSSHESR